MKRISGIAAAVALVATLLAGSGALGASTTTISCGMVVTSSIKASNDLTNCPGSGLLAGANGVTIDLGGHTIDGVGTGDGVSTNGFRNVKVQKGTVQQFSNGVHVDGGSLNASVGMITALQNGTGFFIDEDGAGVSFSYANSNTVGFDVDAMKVKLTQDGAVANSGDGVFIDGASNSVKGSTLAFNGGNGIDATGNAQTIANNRVGSSGNDGVFLSNGKGSTISGNSISNSSGNGVDATGNNLRIEDNTVSRTSNDGITVSTADKSSITGNLVSNSGGNGIDTTGTKVNVVNNKVDDSVNDGIVHSGDQSEVDENAVSNSGGNGIEVSGINQQISDNRVTRTAGNDGIVLSAGDGSAITSNKVVGVNFDGIAPAGDSVTIASNTVVGAVNLGITIGAFSQNQIKSNTVQDAGSDGIRLAGGGDHHQIASNSVFGNDADGINDQSSTSTVKGNLAIGNGNDGIVTTGIDGGGNQAAGNILNQCTGVTCKAPS